MDLNAELVLIKNLTFAGKKMLSGDLVTDEMRATLGPHKLRLWWEAKIIQIRMAIPAKPQVMAAKPAPVAPAPVEPAPPAPVKKTPKPKAPKSWLPKLKGKGDL